MESERLCDVPAQPTLRCPKCKQPLPKAGDVVFTKGKKVMLRIDRLVCEPCALKAAPPVAPVARRRKGEHSKDQETFLGPDCPVIRL